MSRVTQQAPVIDFGALPAPPARPTPPPAPAEPPPAAEPARATVPAPRPRAAAEPAATAPAARAVPRKPRRRRRAASAADDGTGVYLPVSLVERLRTYRRTHGRSYTDITLDAIEEHHEALPALVVPAGVPQREGPLFAGRRPRRVAHEEPHQQVNLRFGTEDLDVIDKLWPAVQAPNRSAMIAAALDAYLPRK